MRVHSSTLRLAAVLGSALALLASGCKRNPAPSDASLTEQVQGRLAADPNLSGQQVQAQVASGVAVLSGTVTSDAARATAGVDAAQIPGIKTVVNNLTLQPAATAPASATVATSPAAPIHTEHESDRDRERDARAQRDADRQRHSDRDQKPSAAVSQNEPPPSPYQQPAPVVRSGGQQMQQPTAPQAPPPPPQPVVHTINLPAGTPIPVRITQTLDSATAQQGDKFTGAIASDVVEDGMVVLPQGTPVTGHVDAVQDASHFKGSSLLTISLTSISRKSERIDITTDPYSKEGQGRGKNTVEKVGGGAALGAILGGIFGGGKGAAIGTIAGGGLGAGAQAATRGQQVQIPSETIVRFRLTNSVPIRVTTGGGANYNVNPGLEHR